MVNIEGGYITASGRRGIHADDTSNVTGGTLLVTNSYEGIEASVINMKGGVSAIYSTDDGWNASNSDANFGESPVIHVSGGYHYVKTGSGDTDGIDSNGDIYFEGGVCVVEAGGNIIDKGDNGNAVYYTAGVFLGFGSQIEGIPSRESEMLQRQREFRHPLHGRAVRLCSFDICRYAVRVHGRLFPTCEYRWLRLYGRYGFRRDGNDPQLLRRLWRKRHDQRRFFRFDEQCAALPARM